MNDKADFSPIKDRSTPGPNRGDHVLAVGRRWPGKTRAPAALLPREGSPPGYAGGRRLRYRRVELERLLENLIGRIRVEGKQTAHD